MLNLPAVKKILLCFNTKSSLNLLALNIEMCASSDSAVFFAYSTYFTYTADSTYQKVLNRANQLWLHPI